MAKLRDLSPVLRLIRVIRREEKAVPSRDRRRRLNWTLCEHRDEAGHEYRKAFESYGEPKIPERGTNNEITKAQKQWS